MKKLILPLVLIGLLLSACGASANNNPAANGTNPGDGGLPPLTMVAVGIFKLEGTDQAVTAKQASDLLPLWEVYSTLSQSDTAAQAEVDALVQQLQDSMTDDQMKAIQNMKLTQQDAFTLMEEKGLTANMPQANGTRTPSNNGSNFNPGEGMPGGGPGGMPMGAGGPPDGGMPGGGGVPNAAGTQTTDGQSMPRRGMDRIPSPLLESLISFLKDRAAS